MRNGAELWALGRKFAYYNDYRPQQGSLSTVDGATKDFAYGELGWTTLVSYVAPGNHRSIRLAERLGAVVDPDAASPEGYDTLVYRHPPAGIATKVPGS